MARGNDAAAAREELAQKLGGLDDFEGLDDLIRAYHASLDPRVQATQQWREDPEAAATLDYDELSTREEVEGGKVISARVKVNRDQRLIVAIVEYDLNGGTYRKIALDYPSETGSGKGKAASMKDAAKEKGADA